MSQTDDPMRGIALSLTATLLFAIADTIAKFLSTGLPIIQINWVRYVIFLGLALILARNTPVRALWPATPWLQVLRACCVIGSSVLFVFGIRSMTMAQATTISFLSPLLITILSIPLLGETVGLRRWAAVGAGMVGMLIVARPGLDGFEPAALFGVASATFWSVALIITRKMSATDPPTTTVLWSAGLGTMLLSVALPFELAWPTPLQWGLMVALGVLASAGQWLVILAYRHAPASVLAPFVYSQLVWATITGYLVFASLPDRWTLVGAAIIIASGLYTAHRERLRSRQRNA